MSELFNKNIKVLYVEDDEIARENGLEYLENFFEHIYEAADAISALKLYETYSPDIIITDIEMPKMNGLEFVKNLKAKLPKNLILNLTGTGYKIEL
ncbi:response regulator [Sulfurimonas sp.]|uniref:response regulator transcription factor n=1 Tax=Sulfurimonas sp. TaxID=2022749 RepID=UPI0025DEF943|nr:response regulator [Sulfurimonas sp.]